jgi:hypothetical protein
MRRLQNLLRRFCKRSIQKPEFSIQNWNPLTGNVFNYSDSCLLYSDFSLANTPEGFFARASRILIIGFQSRLSHFILLG